MVVFLTEVDIMRGAKIDFNYIINAKEVIVAHLRREA